MKNLERLKKSATGIKLLNSLTVKDWIINPDESLNVTIRRDSTKGTFSKIRYTIETDETTCSFEVEGTLGPLETKTFTVPGCSGNIKKISAVPVLKGEEKEEAEEPLCSYGNWVNQGCGLGGCEVDKMHQIRELIIGDEADCTESLEQCNTDPTCSLLSGAVSWWKFDDENDIGKDSVSENHGQAIGDAHIENNELKLDGYGDYVDIPHNDSFDVSELTVSMWVKFDLLPSTYYYLIEKKKTTSQANFFIYRTSSQMIVGFHDGTAHDELKVSFSPSAEWYHIMFTKNNSNQKIYIDGLEKASEVSTGILQSGTGDLYIGQSPVWGGTRYFNGSLDDVMIFDKALSEPEIQEIHDYQKAIKQGGGVLPLTQTGIGITGMVNFDKLPYLKNNVQVLQTSSFSRNGDNTWDGYLGEWSYLYKEGDNFVIFDEIGSGGIYNMWMTVGSDGAVDAGLIANKRILFYFDNEAVPRINMTVGDFFDGNIGDPFSGEPFTSPLTGIISGSSSTRKSYYSFAPILFKERLKIVMDGQPFFYHIISHKYEDSININSFTGNEDYSELKNIWNNKGQHPTSEGNLIDSGIGINIPAGQTFNLIDYFGSDYNYISSIKIDPSGLDDVWIKMYWDGETMPSVNAPIGEFFGSGIGEVNLESLPIGMSTTGNYYCYFPMPFTNSAKIQIENQGSSDISIDYEIKGKKDSNMIAGYNAGYFHAKYNKEFPTQEDKDYVFLNATGRGHYVGVVHTMRGLANMSEEESSTSRHRFLEGDERFFIDGKLSPNMHGTGSEDYYLGAYFFQGKPYDNPMFGIHDTELADGRLHSNPYRFQTSDFVPFTNSVLLKMEHGGLNGGETRGCWGASYWKSCNGDYSSVAFYYSVDESGTILTYEHDISDGTSQTYKYPGYDLNIPKSVSDDGREFTNSYTEFISDINPDNKGIVLRRRLDYNLANQLGEVYIDNQYVGKWYIAGMHNIHNPSSDIRWLDSDFHIPAQFTNGKDSITIKIESDSWNEFYYWIYSKIN